MLQSGKSSYFIHITDTDMTVPGVTVTLEGSAKTFYLLFKDLYRTETFDVYFLISIIITDIVVFKVMIRLFFFPLRIFKFQIKAHIG